MEPTYGDYDLSEVSGIDTLKERMADADTIRDWSFILSDYISFGNNKIAKNTGIFNFNAATDCPNAETDNCQVPFDDCYAHKAENIYPNTLDYRRRQEYLRDSLDAETFANAFLELVSRKRNEVVALRFSEAGDFRHNADIYWADRVAEILTENGIHVYTYSASNYLDWDYVEHLTINQSNDIEDYGDRLYTAVPEEEDIPEDAFQCAYEKSDGEIKCGSCLMCVDKDFDSDIYITLH